MEVKNTDVISYISFVVNRYNKERKNIDKIGCKEIIKSLIIYNELEDYIKDITFKDTNDYSMAYSYFDKSIIVNYNFINKKERNFQVYYKIFGLHDDHYISNIDIIYTLIHEVMHAKQYKFLDTSNDAFLKEILRKSLTAVNVTKDNREEMLRYDEASKKASIYLYDPAEINADAEAIKQTILIIKKMDLPNKQKYISMYETMLKTNAIVNYKKHLFGVTSPIEVFFKRRSKYIKDDYKLNKKEIYKYSFDERLSYGLCITKWEYVNLDKEIKSIVYSMIK
jgi:hypothetical protein